MLFFSNSLQRNYKKDLFLFVTEDNTTGVISLRAPFYSGPKCGATTKIRDSSLRGYHEIDDEENDFGDEDDSDDSDENDDVVNNMKTKRHVTFYVENGMK